VNHAVESPAVEQDSVVVVVVAAELVLGLAD
jgi:hypothetical protein